MTYEILWSDRTLENIQYIDKALVREITIKVSNHLAQNPFDLGKKLMGTFKGFLRYGCENYRMIYEINEMKKAIIVYYIGHQSTIYDISSSS